MHWLAVHQGYGRPVHCREAVSLYRVSVHGNKGVQCTAGRPFPRTGIPCARDMGVLCAEGRPFPRTGSPCSGDTGVPCSGSREGERVGDPVLRGTAVSCTGVSRRLAVPRAGGEAGGPTQRAPEATRGALAARH